MKMETIYRKAILAIIAALCFILPNASAQNLEKGLHLIDMDQYHNAAVVFKNLTKQTPADADAWYYLGLCYSEIGNADSASIAFNAGFAADPKNPANLSGQAMVLHMNNNDVQAKVTLVQASKLSQKKYPNGLVSVIEGYAFCKFPVDPFISGVYQKAQDNNAKNPNIYLKWGEVLYNAKDYGGASLAYQRASSYDEKNVLSHYLQGKIYNAARNSSAALVEIDAALEIDPGFVPAIKEKGDSYAALKKYDDAATWYAKYIQLTEETVASLSDYARVLFQASKYDKAHEIIAKILAKEPNNPVMLRLMGWVSYETKNDADGIDAMTKFFKIRKDSASGIIPKDYEYMAKMAKRADKDSLAIFYILKTMAADSSNLQLKVEFISDLGDFYLKQKKYVESARYYEKAQTFRTGIDGKLQFKIASNYLVAAKLLQPADSVLKLQYMVKADSAYSKVCQSSPNVYVGYLSRARLANLIDPDGSKGIAKPFYEKTLELALAKPEENKTIIIESYQYMASQIGLQFMAAIKAKEKDKQPLLKAQVIDILNKILALAPDNPYALENMKSLNPPAKKPGAPVAK